jgi:hypothetical protein
MIKKLVLLLFFCLPFSLSASLASQTFYMSDADLERVIDTLGNASYKKDAQAVIDVYNVIGHTAFVSIASSLYWNCGNSLLHKAAYDDAGEIVFFLLWLGMSPNLLNLWHETALMHSIHFANENLVKLFLLAKVDLTIKNFQQKTAVDIAIQCDHKLIVYLLKSFRPLKKA